MNSHVYVVSWLSYRNTCPLFQINKVTFHLSKTGPESKRSTKGKKAAVNPNAAKGKKPTVKKTSTRKHKSKHKRKEEVDDDDSSDDNDSSSFEYETDEDGAEVMN